MTPLRIFIGYDSREPIAYHVLAHSILRRASIPVAITPLVQNQLRRGPNPLYWRERGPTESTEFSLTRFLVPYLSGYEGISVFMDCDMLCRVDIAKLLDAVLHTNKGLGAWSVACCQHDYAPRPDRKFLGQPQTTYPRKNWSSLMVFHNNSCRTLTPEYVNTASGLELHRLNWVHYDWEILSLPIEWNWLVGEYESGGEDAHILHYTLGGPWFPEYARCDYALEWHAERVSMVRCG